MTAGSPPRRACHPYKFKMISGYMPIGPLHAHNHGSIDHASRGTFAATEAKILSCGVCFWLLWILATTSTSARSVGRASRRAQCRLSF